MRNNRQRQADYEELNQRYLEAFAQKEELEYELSMVKAEHAHLQRQDNEIRSLHQNIRRLKHDMKNHLMVVASCLNGEDYEGAKLYISEMMDRLNAMHSYIETGNSLMNHILNEKLEWARTQGILVKAEIENLAFVRMKSIDFASVLSNLLDNAVEASLREKDVVPELDLHICKRRGYETISVKNRISASVLEGNPQLSSTKEDAKRHGIGLSQVKSITEAYGGMYDFYEEEGYFCASVFIPE